MQYVKVESSQIAAVAYEPETQTLGLQFPPTKKQLAAGQPGSEYHYSNVTPRTHQALMAAESIGSYFGQNIKSKPDLYPYTKVETENPPQPPSSPNGGGVPKTSSHSIPSMAPETKIESPGSALALIDTMSDDLLFTPGKVTDEQLATMRSDWLAEAKKHDISTEKSRTELKRFARPLQKLRTGIEARAKELTGATKRKIAAIDAEKRRLVEIVGSIEGEVLAPLTAWEQEEETRKTRLARDVAAFAEAAQVYRYPDLVTLGAAIYELENADVSTFQEFKVGAESAIAASLKVLKPELERRKQAEADRAELDRLRAIEAKRQEDARIEAKAKELLAKQTAPVVEPEKPSAADLDAVAEEQNIAEATRYRLPGKSVADRKNEVLIKIVIVDALKLYGVPDHVAANRIVNAIAQGRIPHVTINY